MKTLSSPAKNIKIDSDVKSRKIPATRRRGDLTGLRIMDVAISSVPEKKTECYQAGMREQRLGKGAVFLPR